MPAARSRIGYALLATVPLLLGVAYYAAWQAGCYFDGKQGAGNIQSAEPWSIAAFVLIAVSWLALSIGIPIAIKPSPPVFFGSLLVVSVLFLPLAILLIGAADSSGVRACWP